MAIAQGYKDNFETLRKAFKYNDVALMECFDTKTESRAVLLCAVNQDETTKEIEFVPFAQLLDENPYERFIPPE